ncbi:MAG TPA: DUF1491 family protein [Sphingomonas sp.]|uniref:DUF1491 family protein n=1 Tax=Sphingomonas sp. TaxID=28214 RepID=UPI002ED95125
MTAARLTSALLVSVLLRQMAAGGGHAMVLAKGDATAGAILIVVAERGRVTGLLERVLGQHGYRLAPAGPSDPDGPGAIDAYIAGRRRRDPDLWVVELDGAEAAATAEAVMA